MTLPASGPISLQDIQAEFGGSASNIALQSYYRGGGLVPDVAGNAGIPTSGAIALQDFYGAANVFVANLTVANSGGGTNTDYGFRSANGGFTSSFGSSDNTDLFGNEFYGFLIRSAANLVITRIELFVAGHHGIEYFNDITFDVRVNQPRTLTEAEASTRAQQQTGSGGIPRTRWAWTGVPISGFPDHNWNSDLSQTITITP